MTKLLEIGKKIAEEHKRQGLTQEGLAGLSDMDRSFLSEIENGHKNFSITTLLRISEALKVDVSFFLEDKV
jgi:transcriptional regulator with XRE-family HTH domain